MSARKTVKEDKEAAVKTSAKAASKAKLADKVDPKMSRARKAAKVVGKVMTSVNGGVHNEADIFSELGKLAKYIRDAKREIAALRPTEVKDDFLPSASDELDAIVGATADATNAIMDATEIIEEVMGTVESEPAAKLMTATTAIYEACTFQDITGQRVTRVVKTLQDIESKVDDLLKAFDTGAARPKTKGPKKKALRKVITDEDLLNGPQDAGKAKSQAEIDALLASFD